MDVLMSCEVRQPHSWPRPFLVSLNVPPVYLRGQSSSNPISEGVLVETCNSRVPSERAINTSVVWYHWGRGLWASVPQATRGLTLFLEKSHIIFDSLNKQEFKISANKTDIILGVMFHFIASYTNRILFQHRTAVNASNTIV